MDDTQLNDLKQFIDSRISQSEERLKTDLTQEIITAKTELRDEMREGFEGVGDAIDQIHTELSDHETRITKLEDSAAAA